MDETCHTLKRDPRLYTSGTLNGLVGVPAGTPVIVSNVTDNRWCNVSTLDGKKTGTVLKSNLERVKK